MSSLILILPLALLLAPMLHVLAVVAPSAGDMSTLQQQWQMLHGDGDHAGSRVRLSFRLLALALASGVVLWQATNLGQGAAQRVTLAFLGLYLLLIAVIDLDHHLVLNRMLLATVPLLLALSLLGFLPALPSALAASVVGLLLFGLLALIGRGAMGMGDVKLAAWIGFVTGFPQVFVALLLGIVAGGVGAGIMLLSRRIHRQQSIAYAPYLALGAWLVLIQSAHLPG